MAAFGSDIAVALLEVDPRRRLATGVAAARRFGADVEEYSLAGSAETLHLDADLDDPVKARDFDVLGNDVTLITVATFVPVHRHLRQYLVATIVAGGLAAASWSSATAAPVRQDVSQASVDEQRIEFAPGTDNAIRDGHVAVGATDRWILNAGAGQVMDLTVDSADDNTVFTVFAPDRTALATVSNGAFWSGTLPTSGDYAVEITSAHDSAYYVMKVWIDAGYRDPLGLVRRMSFAPGANSGAASGAVVRASFDTWLLGAAAGQTMEITVTSVEGNSTFDVVAPDGTGMTAPDDRTMWTGQLVQNGDYRVVVQPTRGNATYTLTVHITGGGASTPVQQTPPPAAQGTTFRLSFAPGTDHGTVTRSIAAGATDYWILGAAAGQYMALFIESDTGDISADISDPSGIPLASAQYEVSVLLVVNGDYVVDVTNASGIVGSYDLTVWIT